MANFEIEMSNNQSLNLIEKGTYKTQEWQILGALPGETVDAMKIRTKGGAKAVAQHVLANSHPNRITPKCEHFMTCAGCQLQHLSSSNQIQIKKDHLAAAFYDAGIKFDHLSHLAAESFHYRRRARLSVKWNRSKEELLIGFREFHSRFVTRMSSCSILPEIFSIHLPLLKQVLSELTIRENIPQIEFIQHADGITIIIRHLDDITDSDIHALKEFKSNTNWQIFLHGNKNKISPLSQDDQPLMRVINELGNTVYHFGLNDFIQVNEGINNLILKTISSICGPSGNRLIDFFCGIGNIGLALAPQFKQVLGFELSEDMVERAHQNAQLNSLTNCEFQAANLFHEIFPKAFFKSDDIVILDPPRSGAEHLVTILSEVNVSKIVYVSCNHETLIADIKVLSKKYEVEQVIMADMFSQTLHIETMVVLKPIPQYQNHHQGS